MTQTRTQKVAPTETNPRRLAIAINGIIDGRTDNYGSVTLTASTATTVVSEARVTDFSTVVLTPRTANAAAELGAGGMYVSAMTDGSFTITHANNAQSDRTFDYSWSG
jgi:hypothetical protein